MDEVLHVQMLVLDFAFGHLLVDCMKNFGDEQTDQSMDLPKLYAGFRAQRQFRRSLAAMHEKNSTTNKLIKTE